MRRLFSILAIVAGSAAMLLSPFSSTATPVAARMPAAPRPVAAQEEAVATGGFTFAGAQEVGTYRPVGPVRGVAISCRGTAAGISAWSTWRRRSPGRASRLPASRPRRC
ncbi:MULTISPECIES: hypothetical protein [unclassified Sphingomonas]|uniref:hypothetical protein n=1 Tax=unclassified Sphingomonas TaxID=196159 RepID=UPI0012E3DC55|nr:MULTISPECIES: hypothetical protein [unclassified Sphingomonas]